MCYLNQFCRKMWIVWLFLVGALHFVAGHRQKGLGIIGGNPVEIAKVPYMASLRLNESYHLCGASIVDEWFILSAAHCIGGNTKFTVVLGSSRLDGNGDKYIVDKIIMHPNYSASGTEYDAVLLRVSKPIVLKKDVQKIKLPDKEENLKEGDLLNITGWGQTETADVSNKLLIVQIPYVPRNICQKSYTEFLQKITESMLCAGKKGQDSCAGDSGGPLVYQNVQVGITSFGINCGIYPGVYTRVYSIRKWISETIHNKGN